jgi:hypothetical protein
MSGQTNNQNSLNLLRNANQIQQVGNVNPPNMGRIPELLLNTASPGSFNLTQNTRTNLDVSERAQASCASYEGIEGLRRLQKDQANRSYYDAGCGWVYKPSSGITPEINRGALGMAQGPSRETLRAGTKWYWDLDDAEKDISKKICSNVTKCKNMAALGKFTNVCGFCKTTNAMIPVVKQGSGYTARYQNDSSLMCESENIVSAGYGKCPTDGFTDMTGEGMGSLNEAFVGSIGQTADDLFENCSKGPLSRDCVVLAARLSGCSDKGTLITSLNAAPKGADYDKVLGDRLPFKAYQSTANPSITKALVKDGSTGLATALSDFQNLLANTTQKSDKLRLSAHDLCLKAGEYDNYNFCNELKETTIVSKEMLPCLYKNWKQLGGTESGTGYTQIATFVGKPYSKFNAYVRTIFEKVFQEDKGKNATGIKEFIGVNTDAAAQQKAGALPRNDDTRGAETVWIDLGDAGNGSIPPIVLRCDMRLAKDGEVFPDINNKNDLVSKYSVPADNIALTSAFEIRTDKDDSVKFSVRTDDGFMIGKNQNPFEGTASKGNDWGSWRYQGPTGYESQQMVVKADSKGEKNIFVTKWFQGGGGAVFKMELWSPSTRFVNPSTDARGRQNLYLTQEPLAPWMQFEVCTRPNAGNGNRNGFFEKRWNGQAAYMWGTGKPIWSFDTDNSSGGITYQLSATSRKNLPRQKPYMSLTSQSWWNTRSQFAFTAFKTITLLIRPEATIADGATVSIFHHINFKNTFGTGLYLKRTGTQYRIQHWVGSQKFDYPVQMNDWNLIVLQYIGDTTAISNVTCDVFHLNFAKTVNGRRAILDVLRRRQGGTGKVLYTSAVQNRNNAGHLILGGTSPNYKDANNKVTWQTQSFTGDVAWIHGFRTYIDSDAMLKAEIDQNWISRWARGNIDGEKE